MREISLLSEPVKSGAALGFAEKEGSLGWRVEIHLDPRDGPRRERAAHACMGVVTRYRMCASRLYGPAASADGARRCTVARPTPSALSFLRIEAIAVAS
jgi:hypothetical protein